MTDPQISAIIPNFNHAKFLPRSVGSFLNQPLLPVEIILIDDCSTDNSVEVMMELARQNPIIRVERNERNVGVNASMNRAMGLAKGDYVLFTAADDELRPGVFQHATRMLRQYPQAGLCSGICEWRCTMTGQSWLNGGRMPNKECYLSPKEMVQLSKQGRLGINNQNTVYKKSALQEAGGWLPELHWFSDWFADCAVGFRYGMCHVPEVLSNFYLHPGSYYNAKAGAHKERRVVMERMLEYLESPRFGDVTPYVSESGFMGLFGWPMMKLVLSDRKHWRFLSPTFVRLVGKRQAEIIGRRFFPDWLARFCLRTFYGRK
jgi:glycosyltransferase involved in cell wall biosynthesis